MSENRRSLWPNVAQLQLLQVSGFLYLLVAH
jgi:hypothetical protein